MIPCPDFVLQLTPIGVSTDHGATWTLTFRFELRAMSARAQARSQTMRYADAISTALEARRLRTEGFSVIIPADN